MFYFIILLYIVKEVRKEALSYFPFEFLKKNIESCPFMNLNRDYKEEPQIHNPGIIGSIFWRSKISLWQLILDIESNCHLSLTADSEIM
jgi:hypothetical protein